jgi:hypothetical protein
MRCPLSLTTSSRPLWQAAIRRKISSLAARRLFRGVDARWRFGCCCRETSERNETERLLRWCKTHQASFAASAGSESHHAVTLGSLPQRRNLRQIVLLPDVPATFGKSPDRIQCCRIKATPIRACLGPSEFRFRHDCFIAPDPLRCNNWQLR